MSHGDRYKKILALTFEPLGTIAGPKEPSPWPVVMSARESLHSDQADRGAGNQTKQTAFHP